MYIRFSPPLWGAGLLLAVTAATGVQAQDQAVRSQAESTKAFLAHKRDVQQRRAGQLPDVAALGQVTALVRAARLALPAPSFVTDDATRSALNDSFLVDVAQTLSLFGVRVGDLKQSGSLAQAAAAHIRGGATIAQEALLADTVVIGHVTAMDATEQFGDGAASSVSVVVDQVLKGDAKAGDTLKLRRTSGRTPDGRQLSASDEDPLADGTAIAVVGSRSRYDKELAAPGGGARCPACIVEVVPAFLVDGRALVPTGGFATASTIDALTAATK